MEAMGLAATAAVDCSASTQVAARGAAAAAEVAWAGGTTVATTVMAATGAARPAESNLQARESKPTRSPWLAAQTPA
eukprot:63787-Chlamydomonas_euryale.AAC.1